MCRVRETVLGPWSSPLSSHSPWTAHVQTGRGIRAVWDTGKNLTRRTHFSGKLIPKHNSLEFQNCMSARGIRRPEDEAVSNGFPWHCVCTCVCACLPACMCMCVCACVWVYRNEPEGKPLFRFFSTELTEAGNEGVQLILFYSYFPVWCQCYNSASRFEVLPF